MANARVRVVLVATDLEARSNGALRLAATIAASAGARLVVLHVIELPPKLKSWSKAAVKADSAIYRRLLSGQVIGAEDTVAKQIAEHCAGLADVRGIARIGWVAETVGEVADQVKADLIVVSRGRGGKLGRHSERIVRLEGRAVLVAPVKLPSQAWLWSPRARPRLATTHRRRAAAATAK